MTNELPRPRPKCSLSESITRTGDTDLGLYNAPPEEVIEVTESENDSTSLLLTLSPEPSCKDRHLKTEEAAECLEHTVQMLQALGSMVGTSS